MNAVVKEPYPGAAAIDAAIAAKAAAFCDPMGNVPDTFSPIEQALSHNPTESNLALAFVHRKAGQLLYCDELGGWLEWIGTHWKRDKTQQAFNYCVNLARSLPSGGKTVGKASFAKGVEKIASAEPSFARVAESFDLDRDLLATPQGTINLRTGELQASRPEDMITRCCGASPALGMPFRWLDFLSDALEGDADSVEFLQEFLGYSLTGHIGAELFVYFDGPGGNGKGCITSVMRMILGDYFHVAPAQLLLYTPMPQHPTSMAALRGKRLVVASELPVGARLDEQRLKMISGGDAIQARLMRADEFEFLPELKLAIASNHQPKIVRPDDAMRRRLRVIRMPKVIANPDPAFKHTVLPGEVRQIMHWLLEGAARVLARGEKFVTPDRVKVHSDEYLGSQDSIGTFITERCETGFGLACDRTNLYRAYCNWAESTGESFVMSAREFYPEMEKRRFSSGKSNGERVLKGIRLLPI